MNKYYFTVDIEGPGYRREIELVAEFFYIPAHPGSLDGYGQSEGDASDEEIELLSVRVVNKEAPTIDYMIANDINESIDENDQLADEILNSREGWK